MLRIVEIELSNGGSWAILMEGPEAMPEKSIKMTEENSVADLMEELNKLGYKEVVCAQSHFYIP